MEKLWGPFMTVLPFPLSQCAAASNSAAAASRSLTDSKKPKKPVSVSYFFS